MASWQSLLFKSYSAVSILSTAYLIHKAVNEQSNFYDRVVVLSSNKLNLMLLLNCVVVILTNAANIFVFVFFSQIRILEGKYLVDKSQKKVFQLLLISIVLRNSLDIYKLITIVCILFVWMLHWLASKRLKGLIGEENRSLVAHVRLQTLFVLMIGFDGTVSYLFMIQFMKFGNKMNDIYVIAGFEFARLLLKAIQDNFKYQVSIAELFFKEQWLEKKFVFNLTSMVFDMADLALNVRVFLFVVSRGSLPLYLLGEVVDNLTRIGTSLVNMYKWRQFILKLKKLNDVQSQEGQDLQCCICLGSIAKGKQLSCGHVFHLVCLRAWLIEKVECPTCRAPIQLDKQQPSEEARPARRQQPLDRVNLDRGQRRDLPVGAPRIDDHPDQRQDETAPKTEPEPHVVPNQVKGIFETQEQQQTKEQRRNQLLRIRNKITDDLQEKQTELLQEMRQLLDEKMDLKFEDNEKEQEVVEKAADKEDDWIDVDDDIVSGDALEKHQLKQELKATMLTARERIDELFTQQSQMLPLTDSDSESADDQDAHQDQFRLPVGGSVAYGLPTLAVTRRTQQGQAQARQIDEVNQKLCKIMRIPNEYVKINATDLVNNIK